MSAVTINNLYPNTLYSSVSLCLSFVFLFVYFSPFVSRHSCLSPSTARSPPRLSPCLSSLVSSFSLSCSHCPLLAVSWRRSCVSSLITLWPPSLSPESALVLFWPSLCSPCFSSQCPDGLSTLPILPLGIFLSFHFSLNLFRSCFSFCSSCCAFTRSCHCQFCEEFPHLLPLDYICKFWWFTVKSAVTFKGLNCNCFRCSRLKACQGNLTFSIGFVRS